MPRINVDRKFATDTTYRYTMPEVEIKAEGGGNGKRTLLLNIAEIALELKRSSEVIVSFLSLEFGCQNIINKEGKFVLYGDFTKQIVQNKIYDFIDAFVLCKKCNNPETFYTYTNEKKNCVCMKCNACPETSLLPMSKNGMKVEKQIIQKMKDEEKQNK